ncbi:MAG: glycosyltransferase family 2 protein [Phycisphaeraceae bacterium]|nr:glycosyltransferase family 2 protein [Phycisphaeraceae bacterium]
MSEERKEQRVLPDISIVVPVYNEVENLRPLHQEVRQAMTKANLNYELICVDDGSKDGSRALLREIAAEDPRVVVIELARNFGQSAAMSAGFELACGQVITALDADLQNDPNDIPAMLEVLQKPPGYDVVSGWRKNRQDKLWSRKIPSQLANWLIGRVTWTPIHDFGCTLKIYRREVLREVRIYGEMHRFLPAMVKWRGARVTEMPVHHRPRLHGQSKYGLKRTMKVLLDLVTVKFLGDYLTKPIYFFGKLAMMSTVLAFFFGGWSLIERFGWAGREQLNLNRNIFFLLCLILFLATINFVMMGVIAELLVRIYHESQGRTPYRIQQVTRGLALSKEKLPQAEEHVPGQADSPAKPLLDTDSWTPPSLQKADNR